MLANLISVPGSQTWDLGLSANRGRMQLHPLRLYLFGQKGLEETVKQLEEAHGQVTVG